MDNAERNIKAVGSQVHRLRKSKVSLNENSADGILKDEFQIESLHKINVSIKNK